MTQREEILSRFDKAKGAAFRKRRPSDLFREADYITKRNARTPYLRQPSYGRHHAS
jgi:hypothetical protein